MSTTKYYYLDKAQAEIEEEKAGFIQFVLNDENADESHPRWAALSRDFYEQYEQQRAVDEALAEAEWSIKQHPKTLFDNTVQDLNKSFFVLEAMKESEDSSFHFKMLYSYSITVLEAYLSELAIHLVRSYPAFLVNIVSNEDASKALSFSKYPLKEILKDPDFVSTKVIDKLSSVLYHNVGKSVKIFEALLNRKLSIDIKKISQVSDTRHDLVHRNGRTISGKMITINYELVSEAYIVVDNFVRQLNKEVQSSVNEQPSGGCIFPNIEDQ